jgi:hypothetical protein
MTAVPTPPGDRGDKGNGSQNARRRRGARKPRRLNPHFMTSAEAIPELEGLISRNGFYEAVDRDEIPNIKIGRLIFVPRDFITQLKERAVRKLDEPRNSEARSARPRSAPRHEEDGNQA